MAHEGNKVKPELQLAFIAGPPQQTPASRFPTRSALLLHPFPPERARGLVAGPMAAIQRLRGVTFQLLETIRAPGAASSLCEISVPSYTFEACASESMLTALCASNGLN
jgi:hypothetical protein